MFSSYQEYNPRVLEGNLNHMTSKIKPHVREATGGGVQVPAWPSVYGRIHTEARLSRMP